MAKHLVDDSVIQAVIRMESSGNPQAVSPKGAKGLMQLMPIAWKDVQQNVKGLDAFDYDTYALNGEMNTRFGTEYLNLTERRLPEQHRTLPNLLAAYNWGIGNLKKANYDLSKAPRETTNYIGRVVSEIQRNAGAAPAR